MVPLRRSRRLIQVRTLPISTLEFIHVRSPLAPRESQLVKIQVIKSEKMDAGEYRSHIYFRAVPKSKPLGENEALRDTSSFSASLTAVFGITIPVIIRVGNQRGK